jgi:hypothetical protein
MARIPVVLFDILAGVVVTPHRIGGLLARDMIPEWIDCNRWRVSD